MGATRRGLFISLACTAWLSDFAWAQAPRQRTSSRAAGRAQGYPQPQNRPPQQYGAPAPAAPAPIPYPLPVPPPAPQPNPYAPQGAAPLIPNRNQNPAGQPMIQPPHLRQRDDLSGIKNWYGSTGATYGYDTLSRSNPGAAECNTACEKTIYEPRMALILNGAAGWGPIKRNNISFTTHYRYTQNLRTNEDQAAKFGQWFKTLKSGDFIFPTRDMLRSHELVAEIRYSMTPFQFGLHGLLDFERVGSNAGILGAPNEVSESARNIEQVVPWVQWRVPGSYVATLYSPLRTEINKEDPRNSFTTWSLKQTGRGMFVSAILDNLFYLPRIASTAGLSLNWTSKKSASIQNDSSRLGIKTSLDFPIAWNIRLQPYLKYDKETYILQRIRINNTTDGSADLVKRSDSILGSGGAAYLDLSREWRLHFYLNFESIESSLSDFSSSRLSYLGGFTYSWPLTRQVLRRLDRFSDSLSVEEN